MGHEVFISYSSKDRHIADIVCSTLETNKIKCWMAPKSILPGESYASSIMDAISEAKIFLLILTSNSNASEHVLSEVERAFSRNINLITYKVEDVPLRKELQLFLSSKQWLDSLNKEVKEQLSNLVSVIRLYLKKNKAAPIIIPNDIGYELKIVKQTGADKSKNPPDQTHPRKIKLPAWAGTSVFIFLIAAIVIFIIYQFLSGNVKLTDNRLETTHDSPSPAIMTQGDTIPTDITQTSVAPDNTPQDTTLEATTEASATHPADNESIMAFKPSGVAKIRAKDGQEYSCPANCVLFKRSNMTTGFPDPMDDSGESMIPFEEIKTCTVESKKNADGYSTDYVYKITKLTGDVVTYTYTYEPGVLLFTNGDGRIELDSSNIAEMSFDFTKENSAVLKLALVTPVSGNPFYTPADLVSNRILSVGMGVSTDWGSGLPMSGGNTISFKKIHSFDILESKETGINGWGDEATVDIVMNEGDHIKGQIKVDSMFFVGINRLGIFSLDLTDGLKSIEFPK